MTSKGVQIKVTGFRELNEVLKQLPESVSVGILQRVGVKVLQPIKDQAQSLAPVEYGDLKTSIKVGRTLSKRQRARHRKYAQDDVEIYVGAGALPSAHLQEFGTSHHIAQPFMRPAWDAGKDKLLEDIKDELWKSIKRYRKRQ